MRAHYTSHKVPVLYDSDQYSTDFTKCIRYLRAHGHAITSQENPTVTSDNHDLYMTSSASTQPSSTTSTTKSQKLDIVILGGLGGRVDQGFSQVHHLYAAREETMKDIREGRPHSNQQGDLYLLSEESLSFLIPPGRNVIHTPFTYRQDQQQQGKQQENHQISNGEDKHIVTMPPSECIFSENVGIIPLSGPTHISLRGFEWDVTNWRTEIGGQLSTSNHIRADSLEVDVDKEKGRAVLFTVELAERFKRFPSI